MKRKLCIVSMGPGSPDLLTVAAQRALMNAKHLLLRTEKHPVAAFLRENSVPFTTLDDLYDSCYDFDELNQACVKRILGLLTEQSLTYGVMDPLSDESVATLIAALPPEVEVTVHPGLTTASTCLSSLTGTGVKMDGYKLVPANRVNKMTLDPSVPLVVTELDSFILASEVKIALTDLYDDEMPVYFFPSGEDGQRKFTTITLSALDRQRKYDHTACLVVPPADLRSRQRFCLQDLMQVMEILRAPGGCPWDRQQTHETLRKHLIEEAYEACGAIDEKDSDHLADELGDVLWQIVFHASLGVSHGEFNMTDIISNITNKMLHRHTHVFGLDHCNTAEDVSVNWEKLKKAEKGLSTQSGVLADVSHSLPALMRAAKVQKKAKEVGFDWDTAQDALPKVHEEAEEVLAELAKNADPV